MDVQFQGNSSDAFAILSKQADLFQELFPFHAMSLWVLWQYSNLCETKWRDSGTRARQAMHVGFT